MYIPVIGVPFIESLIENTYNTSITLYIKNISHNKTLQCTIRYKPIMYQIQYQQNAQYFNNCNKNYYYIFF